MRSNNLNRPNVIIRDMGKIVSVDHRWSKANSLEQSRTGPAAYTSKEIAACAALLSVAYVFVGFLGFAGILLALFFYLIANRPPRGVALRMAGLPALLAIFVIGAVSTLTLSPFPFSAWNVVKDTYFFIAPVLLLASGVLFLRSVRDFSHVYRASVLALTISSVIIYSDFLFVGGLTNISLQSRYTYGLDSSASILALILTLSFHPTLRSLLRSRSTTCLVLLNLFLIIASLSRINIAITVVSLFFVYSPVRWTRGLTIAIVLLLTLVPLLQITSSATTPVSLDSARFLDKLVGSFEEFRISDYSGLSDINKNWRGYEAYLGMQQVEQVGGIAHLFGVGFGSYVVGPFENKLQNIPFFHNGFVTIYLKAGLLGLMALAFFVFRLYRLAQAAGYEARRNGDLRSTRASVMIALLTNAVLLQTLAAHGIYYSKTTFELFFIGMAIYSLQQARRDLRAKRLTQ